jgi:predicted membrane protein
MFALVRQLFKFWFVLLLASGAAYLLMYNQERIYVSLPGIGEFKVITAIAFIVSFMLGATTVTLYFASDMVKKSWELRSRNKRIKTLEKLLSELGQDVEPKKRNWLGATKTPKPVSIAPVDIKDPL